MFMATYPALGQLNIMGLHTPQSAVLSAVLFVNALIIVALVPLALRGVRYRPEQRRYCYLAQEPADLWCWRHYRAVSGHLDHRPDRARVGIGIGETKCGDNR